VALIKLEPRLAYGDAAGSAECKRMLGVVTRIAKHSGRRAGVVRPEPHISEAADTIVL
jgi:hypothetical protein